MSNSDQIPEDLLKLIYDTVEETLEDKDLAKLEEGLSNNAQARSLFVKLLRQHAELTVHYQAEKAIRPIYESLGVLAQGDQVPTSFLDRTSLALSAIVARTLPSPWMRYAAAILVAVLATMYINQAGVVSIASVAVEHDTPFAASVRATHNASWQMSESPETLPSRSLRVGEMVRLEEGVMQLDFVAGNTCFLEGPAVFEIDSHSSGKLYSGRLLTTAAYDQTSTMVKTRSANLRAKTARIAITANEYGRSTVHVLDGDAEIEIGGSRQERAIRVNLASGDSLHLREDGTFETALDQKPEHFVQNLLFTEDAFHGDVIWLGNLFDDSTTTSLAEAVETDTYQAAAETIDLGVATVLDGGLDVDVALAADGVMFNFSNLGGTGAKATGLPSNDTYRSISNQPIRTTGVHYDKESMRGIKIEEGIGMHANELITFDLDEIRRAGRLGKRQLRFRVDRAGINDDIDFEEEGLPSDVRVIAIVSTTNEVIAGFLNGKEAEVAKHSGVYSFRMTEAASADPTFQEIRPPRYVEFDVPIPHYAKYLTLVATSGHTPSDNRRVAGDHSVFSGARLELIRQKTRTPLAMLGR